MSKSKWKYIIFDYLYVLDEYCTNKLHLITTDIKIKYVWKITGNRMKNVYLFNVIRTEQNVV